ncbi:MAG TPA: PilZ domain-containing protein, partial [Polyangiaceae bacterium]
MSTTNPIERRRHVRTYVPIVATVYSEAFRNGVTCLVSNISIGGALLASTPCLDIGTECRVTLSPIGAPKLAIDSRVLRQGRYSDGSPWVAVQFLVSSATDLKALEAMVARAVLAGRNRAILVADGDASRLLQVATEVEQRALQPLLAS